MSRLYKIFGLCALLAFTVFFACDDDEFVLPDSEPRITGTQALRSMPGETVTVTATVTDPAGLSSVSLDYAPWSVAELTSLSGTETSFDFSFDLAVPASTATGSTHELVLSATNMNDVTLTYPITLTLDLDITMPVFTNQTASGMVFLDEGTDVVLTFDASDDGQIATVSVVGANISDVIAVNSDSYTYSRELNIQTEGVYDFDVVITDNDGNQTEARIQVGAFMPFDAMYATGVTTDAELNNDLMGIPQRIDGLMGADSTGKLFMARYYSSGDNTAVRLLPSTTTFNLLTIGASETPGQLTLGKDATVAPIILPEAGYYEVMVDLRDLSYTVAPYTPADTPLGTTYIIGTGVRVDGQSTCESNADGSQLCYNFGSGKPLIQDPNNPYLFTAEVELFNFDPNTADGNGFILNANPDGWSPFWRFDVGDQIGLVPEATVPNGGANFLFGEDAYGVYNATFDTHLNRFVLDAQ